MATGFGGYCFPFPVVTSTFDDFFPNLWPFWFLQKETKYQHFQFDWGQIRAGCCDDPTSPAWLLGTYCHPTTPCGRCDPGTLGMSIKFGDTKYPSRNSLHLFLTQQLSFLTQQLSWRSFRQCTFKDRIWEKTPKFGMSLSLWSVVWFLTRFSSQTSPYTKVQFSDLVLS